MNCEIDGISFPLEQPASVADLCKLVRNIPVSGLAIYPVGGRTLLDLGLPPTRDGIAIDTTQLDRVIDYPSRDMTITVEAGIRVGKLQEILKAEGQRLPVDVPRRAEATLGGAIATNVSGPRRFGFGTFRDYVIGISVVDADGNESKAGGRVVKNVAGYDLCKLYTGSLGTLGIITQVTLKLRPLPEASAVVWIKLEEAEQAAAALDRLVVSRTRPIAIELLSPAAADHVTHAIGQPLPPAPLVLVVGFEDNAEAVKWQIDQLQTELEDLKVWRQAFEAVDADPIWQALVEFQALQPNRVTFKANIRRSGVVEFFDAAQRQATHWALQSHTGNGIVYGHASSGSDEADVRTSLTKLRTLAVALQGNLVIRRCPNEWKTDLVVWGEPRGDSWLMQAIKRKLDPLNLLNPGRFVG